MPMQKLASPGVCVGAAPRGCIVQRRRLRPVQRAAPPRYLRSASATAIAIAVVPAEGTGEANAPTWRARVRAPKAKRGARGLCAFLAGVVGPDATHRGGGMPQRGCIATATWAKRNGRTSQHHGSGSPTRHPVDLHVGSVAAAGVAARVSIKLDDKALLDNTFAQRDKEQKVSAGLAGRSVRAAAAFVDRS